MYTPCISTGDLKLVFVLQNWCKEDTLDPIFVPIVLDKACKDYYRKY